jgi:RNA polymerase sigma factor (sigma-70 family)
MNKIYIAIAELSDKFKKMCYGLTTNKTDIDDACQELQLYFLSMNPDTLKKIYEKDGKEGILRYGAVVLRRALTSPRSPFYYQYKKYYTHLDNQAFSITYDITESGDVSNVKNLYNISEPKVDNYQWEKLEQIDKILDTLYWYDSKIFQLYYYEGNTLDSLAEKTKISRNSLFNTIDKVREILKKELLEDNQ